MDQNSNIITTRYKPLSLGISKKIKASAEVFSINSDSIHSDEEIHMGSF